jgi:hypothetical protein
VITGSQGHPRREEKIIAWVQNAPATFTTRQAAQDLDLMPSEVGNRLRIMDGVERVRRACNKSHTGAIWRKVEA